MNETFDLLSASDELDAEDNNVTITRTPPTRAVQPAPQSRPSTTTQSNQRPKCKRCNEEPQSKSNLFCRQCEIEYNELERKNKRPYFGIDPDTSFYNKRLTYLGDNKESRREIIKHVCFIRIKGLINGKVEIDPYNEKRFIYLERHDSDKFKMTIIARKEISTIKTQATKITLFVSEDEIVNQLAILRPIVLADKKERNFLTVKPLTFLEYFIRDKISIGDFTTIRKIRIFKNIKDALYHKSDKKIKVNIKEMILFPVIHRDEDENKDYWNVHNCIVESTELNDKYETERLLTCPNIYSTFVVLNKRNTMKITFNINNKKLKKHDYYLLDIKSSSDYQ